MMSNTEPPAARAAAGSLWLTAPSSTAVPTLGAVAQGAQPVAHQSIRDGLPQSAADGARSGSLGFQPSGPCE